MANIKFIAVSRSLSGILDYVTNREKTVERLISGVNCMAQTAQDEFEAVKKQFRKTDGRSYYHIVQAFAPDDPLDFDTAHEIGLKFAKYFKGYQCVVVTHMNTAHIHNHIIMNSVNFKNGQKFHQSAREMQQAKEYSNQLCREYGLSFTESKADPFRIPAWKKRLCRTIKEAMENCATREEFIAFMAEYGYKVRWEPNQKYITYTTPDGMRCRDNKLHEEKYCKEAMEREFRIRAELIKRTFRRAEETDGGIEADESTEQRTAVCATAADDAAHCDPVRSAAGDEQADRAGRRNKLGAGGNSEDPAGIENAHRPDTGAGVSGGDSEIADGDEQVAGTGWEPERKVFLQVDRLAPGLQPAGGPQVDHAGADPWHGGTGGVVWRGGDPRPVPLMSAVTGLTAVGTLLDEDEDAEEKRRRMEAKIAAENFGAAIGFAAGAALAMKEKLDEHAAQEKQKKQQHEQTMGGL